MSKYQALIDALKAGPTDGPWNVIDHSWSDTSIVAPGFDHGICCLDINHATEESQDSDGALMAANAAYIAAANPDTIRSLLADLERAEKALNVARAYIARYGYTSEQLAIIDAALSQLKGVQ